MTDALLKVCSCVWSPGDSYSPPEPIEICEACCGGMDNQQRTAYAMNQYRVNLGDDARRAIRRAMNAVGLHPYTGMTAEQQTREVQEAMDERMAEGC